MHTIITMYINNIGYRCEVIICVNCLIKYLHCSACMHMYTHVMLIQYSLLHNNIDYALAFPYYALQIPWATNL